MSRVLGVDLGSRRIGVAISDAARTTATPLAVLDRARTTRDDHDHLVALARAEGATVIVVGLSIALSGEIETAARRVLSEVDALRRLASGEAVPGDDPPRRPADDGAPIRVEVHDERLSTVTAERSMAAGGAGRSARKEAVDKIAAAVILQSWLEANEEP